MFVWRAKHRNRVSALLQRHFNPVPVHSLVTASRTLPVTSAVDLHVALERLFSERYQARLVGVHAQFCHETLTVPHLVNDEHLPVMIGPLQHNEVDVGEATPARCLTRGLWLSSAHGLAVQDDLVEIIVRKTNKASPAFIKELMRRTAQGFLQSAPNSALTLEHVEAALDEMLFSGGTLNVNLLGGAWSE
jgi:hypothetical protein